MPPFEQGPAGPVRQLGDPALRAICPPVTRFDDALAAQAERMLRLCHDSGGVGLAAPQVGCLTRMFVMALPDEPGRVLVNPRLVAAAGEPWTFDEGCLSIGRGRVTVPVVRPMDVYVVAYDLDGGEFEERLSEFPARVFCHELDHLDGVLTLDRTTSEARRRALGTLRS